MGKNEDNEMMEFVLPRSIDKSNAPEPLSKKLKFMNLIWLLYRSFFWRICFRLGSNRVRKNLEEIAFRNKIKLIGDPIVLVYNSPYKIINRKNEVLFEVDFESIVKKDSK